MPVLLLASLLQAVPAAPPSPQPPEIVAAQRETHRTEDAYGRCMISAALRHSETIADTDAIFDAAVAACVEEEEEAILAYAEYLRLEGVGERSDEWARRMHAAIRSSLRGRVEEVVAAHRTAEAAPE